MTILDNQEVNAAILNGIAKDLGTLDFSEFVDGEKFGVDKLNAITQALVTPGVLGNVDGTCKVTVVDGKISVGVGTIVFGSGAKMKITENQTLELIANTKTYVVAVNDVTNNKMLLCNLDAEPTGEDYVLLAELSVDGVVTQNYNRWAFSKAQSPQNTKKSITLEDFSVPRGTPAGTIVHTIPIDTSMYKIAILKVNRWTDITYSNTTIPGITPPCNGIFCMDISSRVCFGYAVMNGYVKARSYHGDTLSTYGGIPFLYNMNHVYETSLYSVDIVLQIHAEELRFVTKVEIDYDTDFYGNDYTLELL